MSDSNDDDDENTFGPFISPDAFESMQKALGPVAEASRNAAETYQPAAERMAKEEEKLESLRGTLEHVAGINEMVSDATAPARDAMLNLDSVFEAAQKLDSVTAAEVDALANTIGQAETPTGGASRRRRRSATTTRNLSTSTTPASTAASGANPAVGLGEHVWLMGLLFRWQINRISDKNQRRLAWGAATGVLTLVIINYPEKAQLLLSPFTARGALSTAIEMFPGDTDAD